MSDAFFADLTEEGFPWPPLAYLNIREQVNANGYRFEEHEILTDDGYILKAFRIPGPIN